MATVCLNMIVKDEAHVIRRCLESVRPIIDTWVIVDTGSTDGTQDLIREIFADLPGQLHERPWVDFGHNRTEAINLAAGAADYLFFIDADDTLIVPPGYTLPELTEDSYDLDFQHLELRYRRVCMVRNSLGWRFEGVLHEFPTYGVPFVPARLDLTIAFGADGNRSQQDIVQKYAHDAEVLEKALHDDPDNTRYAFYLAQSYKDSRQDQKALAAYDRRAKMGGFDQEAYLSLLRGARIAKGLGHGPSEVMDRLLQAYDARPTRVEALGELAILCRELGNRWASALMFADQGLAIPPSDDVLFVEPDWHQWRLLDERSIALYWLGRYREALEDYNALLRQGVLPDAQRDRVRANKKFAKGQLGL